VGYRFVLLDSGPLGAVCGPPLSPTARLARTRLAILEADGALVAVPEVVTYEVRRELIRRRAQAQLRRLDVELDRLNRVPVTPEAWDRAAEFWAEARRAGRPTADPKALDADAVLAGVAATLGGPDDRVVVATDNAGHLGRFVEVLEWRTVAP
jgi:predicted nucleic acid-binding protein